MSRSRTSKSEGWHRADIMAAVRKKGSSLAGVGRGIGLSRKSMSWALIRPHLRANMAIAEFLGVPAHVLWPQWFDCSGGRIGPSAPRRSLRPQPTTTRVQESIPAACPPSKTAA